MVWIVEARARSVRRGNPLPPLLRAEWRQFWWLQPAVLAAGLGVWALLTVVTERAGTDARPEGVVFNYAGSLLLSVFPLLLAGPVMAGRGAAGRLGLWLGLPLERRTVNLTRLLGLGFNAWPAILTWPLIVSLLARVYGPVSPWVLVNTAGVAGVGILLTCRTPLAPFLVYLLLPLQVALAHVVPGGRTLAVVFASVYASPWMGAACLIAGGGLVAYDLKTHPVRRA